jgi:hypothetical protein
LQKTIVKGFQPKFFNRSCHVWFVLDAETDDCTQFGERI